MDPLTVDFWQPVGMAILCGGILGLEREVSDKPAGLRTCILVCLGAMLFVRLGRLLDHPPADATRVLGQVVTGIGFLGAGVILARGENVRGVTTAAVVWLVAALGAAIALEQYAAALAVTLVATLVLALLGWLAHWLEKPGSGPEQPPPP